MKVYFLLTAAVPLADNEERVLYDSTYVNCFVKSKDENAAKERAVEYIRSEGWQVTDIEEIFAADKERYSDDPEMLACYEQACRAGASAVFYTWGKV